MCIKHLEGEKKPTGCGIVNTTHGQWKSGMGGGGCMSASVVCYIWVVCTSMCVPQLVIRAALSRSAGIDPAHGLG